MAKQPGDDECAPLTAKLAEMLWARGHGSPYRDIGEKRGIKAQTVQKHLRKARELLGVDTEDEAIAEAVRLGIFDLSGPGPLPPMRWTTEHETS